MRQYRILYRGAASDKFVPLQPFAHRGVYERPEVTSAIEIMRGNPHIEGLAIRLGVEMFNIIAFDQPAEAPNAFKFEEPGSAFNGVILDQLEVVDDAGATGAQGGCCGGCPSGANGVNGENS